MNKKLALAILLFFSVFFPFFGNSQEMKVTGIVKDTSGNIPVNKALAMAVRLKDSLLLGFARTDEKGYFELKGFAPDTFSLLISHPKFETKTIFIFGNQNNSEINIPSIKMGMEVNLLENVIIYANKNPIYYSGDTLIYVADSFKVAENAVVEDLLKKLPGVKVDKDGKITSQGKSISQVLVDGDEFFGSDPTVATKNLAAKGVESVKVYEKKSETASDGEDATIQVMDLRLKEDAKKGYFGKSSLASDFQKYHEGELLFNNFNGSQKLSIYALGSTTPRTNVSRADMNKFGLNDNNNGGFMGAGPMQGNNQTKAAGVPQTFNTGIYFTDKIGKKKQTKIGLNYNYNNYQLISSSASRSKYALPDTTYYSDDSTHNIDISQTHKLNFNFNTQIDSLTSFEIKPKLTISNSDLETNNISGFLTEDELTSRNSLISNITNSKGLSLDNELNFYHKFMKPKRQISFKYDLSGSTGNSTGSLNSYNQYLLNGQASDTTVQTKINTSNTQTHVGTLTYTEPLTKKIKMEFEYLYEYGLSSQNKETRNDDNSINSFLTNNFSNLRQQHRFGTAFIYESRIQTITANFRLRNIDIQNDNITLDTTIHQNLTNFLPRFNYSYKPSPSKRLSINYNTRSSQPAINDLQNVQNNTNPNRIVLGNPDLKPNYEHSMNIGFNSWQALSGRYIWGGINSTITNNAFGTITTYLPDGVTTSQTVNVNGNMYNSVSISGGLPIFNKKLEINPDINYSRSKYSSYIKYSTDPTEQKNTTITDAMTLALDLELTLDSLEVAIGGSYTYNNPTNSISSLANNPYTLQKYTASIDWTLPWKLKIGTDATYTINGQRANGYNINYFVWNATLSRSFLETENLVLTLSGNDILNQNISALRTVNGNITTDNRTKIISRYYLLKLVYKFNNRKAKEEDARSGWH